MRSCPACGLSVPGGTVFCPACGWQDAAAATRAPEATIQSTPPAASPGRDLRGTWKSLRRVLGYGAMPAIVVFLVIARGRALDRLPRWTHAWLAGEDMNILFSIAAVAFAITVAELIYRPAGRFFDDRMYRTWWTSRPLGRWSSYWAGMRWTSPVRYWGIVLLVLAWSVIAIVVRLLAY